MKIFGANTVVFGANMVVSWREFCGIWSKIQRGEEKWGGVKSGVRLSVLNPHLKRRGKGTWGKYSGAFGNYGDIWGKYRGILGKNGGIWYLGESIVVFGQNTKGGVKKGV